MERLIGRGEGGEKQRWSKGEGKTDRVGKEEGETDGDGERRGSDR